MERFDKLRFIALVGGGKAPVRKNHRIGGDWNGGDDDNRPC